MNSSVETLLKYSIMCISSDMAMDLLKSIKIKFSFNTWRIISKDALPREYLFGIKNALYNKYLEISFECWYFLGEESTALAVSISENYYLRFDHKYLHLSGEYHFTENSYANLKIVNNNLLLTDKMFSKIKSSQYTWHSQLQN
ncbi:hypothetical protein [Fluviispira sanaruensis]|uniref:hypothetical protein n=1 Tax=Fluviispira sanaruensis TaxID=2493639 RepID=UPI00102E4B91|nr:hypothetical protein [Fluviispira sanaruensis]